RDLSDAHGHDPDPVRRGLRHRRCGAADRADPAGAARPDLRRGEPCRRRRLALRQGTLLLTTNSTHSAANGLFKNVPYDPIKDFTPIARIGSFSSYIGVTPDKPYQSMKAL